MAELSVHDNLVYAYCVLCKEQRIVLYTEYHGKNVEEFTDVLFTGVVAHHFEDVLRGNILFDVEEVPVQNIVREWAALFDRRKNYGWPDQIEYRDLDHLIDVLQARGVKAYDIGSSFGLFGFVFAMGMELRARQERAVPHS